MMNRSFVYFVLTVDRQHVYKCAWTDVSIPEKSDNFLQFLNMALRPTRHNSHALDDLHFSSDLYFAYTHTHIHASTL